MSPIPLQRQQLQFGGLTLTWLWQGWAHQGLDQAQACAGFPWAVLKSFACELSLIPCCELPAPRIWQKAIKLSLWQTVGSVACFSKTHPWLFPETTSALQIFLMCFLRKLSYSTASVPWFLSFFASSSEFLILHVGYQGMGMWWETSWMRWRNNQRVKLCAVFKKWEAIGRLSSENKYVLVLAN